VIYLDTGCLVKLYYPEPDSPIVATLVAGKPICYNPLHELEFTNALHLKLFHRSATPNQVQAALALVETDVKSGVLHPSVVDWEKTFRTATDLARQHSASLAADHWTCYTARRPRFLKQASFSARTPDRRSWLLRWG
jgi:hypothetical protein